MINCKIKIIHPLNWVCLTAPSEEIVKRAIEHIYPLVLPFCRSKLLDDKRLMSGGRKTRGPNIEILESNEDHLFDYRRPVGVLVNGDQMYTDIVN